MPSNRKPRIGVTGPDRGGWPAWQMTRFAVWRSGGRALRMTPSQARSIHEIDGLVIGGGADVDPALYGAPLLAQVRPQIKTEARRLHRSHQKILDFLVLTLLWLMRAVLSTRLHQTGDQHRDVLESHLIRQALEHDLPLLGICRGMQLLNVLRGGSLHQDITGFYEEVPHLRTVLPRKRIEIEPRSRLHALAGTTRMYVNSLHKQSIDRLGRDLRIVAQEPNGIIQAIEDARRSFILGVQWHPEYLPQDRRQLELFKALVDSAQTKARRASSERVAETQLETLHPLDKS